MRLVEKGKAILEANKKRERPADSNKCVICGRHKSIDGLYCRQHKIAVDKAMPREKSKAFRYACYRGHVVGFYKTPNGNYKPSYVGMSLRSIPKSILINLDNYCPGFNRQQVKRLKAVVLRLSS